MRSLVRPVLGALLVAPLALSSVACSSGDGAPPTKHEEKLGPTPPPDDGFQWSTPPGPATVSITGQGSVYSGDADASVACTGTGTATTGTCVARQQSTLYVSPASGWYFSHWEPAGSTSSYFYVDPSTPSQITAVFGERKH